MVQFRLSASEAVSVSSIAVTANRNINGSGGLSRSYYYRYGGFSVRLVRG